VVHLISGDSAAECYRLGGGAGEVRVWREALVAGPMVHPGQPDWAERRAKFLQNWSARKADEIRRELTEQLEAVVGSESAVTLWFGRDLFCLASLMFIGAALDDVDSQVDVKLVLPDETGTKQRPCIGSYQPDQLVALSATARPLLRREREAAALGWQAICSDDVNALDRAHNQVADVPWVARALDLQRRRRPSARDGLSELQRSALQLIDGGTNKFGELLAAFSDANADFGWTDLLLYQELRSLAEIDQPLITMSVHTMRDSSPSMTDRGRDVLAGKVAPVDGNGLRD